MRRVLRWVAAGGALVAGLAAPAIAAAHGLTPVYQSPLPLPVYLAGAAATVGLSFAFVLARDVRALPAEAGDLRRVPGVVRVALRVIGLVAWAWVLAQGLVGFDSNREVATLFLWIYGWVGLAGVSALVGPAWAWLDPFTTLHDIGAWTLRRLGIGGWQPVELPARLHGWPAVAGMALVIWLELVLEASAGDLRITLAGYTLFTLAMMAQFGRDAWRAHGETFSVWFGLLGRLAPFGTVPATATSDAPEDEDPDALDPAHVRRRPFASGLMEARWTRAEIVVVAFGTGSILFDGLSQTTPWAAWFGRPSIPLETVLLAVFLGLIAFAALGVARAVSPGAMGAGLLPIAVGYLIAHYLTYLLIEGQRIIVSLSDPFQTGANLFGTAFFEPSGEWLPAGLLWTVQLASVVGGHMLGAWAGHVTAARDADAEARASGVVPVRERRAGVRLPAAPIRGRDTRLREVPLALVMVVLTTITLWSLGQAIVVEIDTSWVPAAAVVGPA